ncbi:hypothetical protein CWE17_07175 [Synechococcus sp. BS56D]|nr:hypothetical protein CWE17_07175 [Synechococcus sp. BS56D]
MPKATDPQPILFRSRQAPSAALPIAFEAMLPTRANLSGFTPAHQFLGSELIPFPLLLLA